mgnify:FL=1
MKKIIIFAVLLSMITGAAVFAAGDQEDDYGDGRSNAPGRQNQPGRMPGSRDGYGPRYEDRREGFDGEIITLTGTVKLEGEWHPELETVDRTYELMYPPFLDDGLDVQDGEEITVEGYLVPGPRWEEAEEVGEELHLHVTKAVIDGKEYVVEHPGPRHGGRRGGMVYGRPGSRRDGRGAGGQGRGDAGRKTYGGPGCFRDGASSWDDERRDSRGYGGRW